MALPQFSLKRLLLLCIALSIFFALLGNTVLELGFRMGVLLGVFYILCGYLIHAGTYLIFRRKRVSHFPAHAPDQQEQGSVPRNLVLILGLAASLLNPRLSTAEPISGEGDNWQIQVNDLWRTGPGYHLLTIVATAKETAKADRTLAFSIRLEKGPGQIGQREILTLEEELLLPEGELSASLQVLLPPSGIHRYIKVEVSENGKPLQKLSSRLVRRTNAFEELVSVPCTIVVGDKLDIVSFAMAMPQRRGLPEQMIGNMFRGHVADNVQAMAQLQSLTYLRADELPGYWLKIASIDLLVISGEDLRSVSSPNDPRFSALQDWIWAGGNLLVYWDASQSPDIDPKDSLKKHREFLQQLFDFPDQNVATADGIIDQNPDAFPSGWQSFSELSPNSVEDMSNWEIHSLGLGSVTLTTTPADRISKLGWQSYFANLGVSRCVASHKLGFTAGGKNPQFWSFVVPGVGMAPVRFFQIVVTIFGLVIGPGCYFWLRAQNKLHWMLIVPPLAAAIVGTVMLGYLFFVHGFGTKVRMLSWTYIDRSRDQAVSLARICYFPGRSVNDGLEFPLDTAVFPLGRGVESSSHRGYGVSRGIQHYQQHWLPVRQFSQFVTVTSRHTSAEIMIQAPANDTEQLQVINRLNSTILRLAVWDENRNLWSTSEPIAPGMGSSLSANMPDSWNEVRSEIIASLPTVPQYTEDDTAKSPQGRRPSNGGVERDLKSAESSRLDFNLRRIAESPPRTGTRHFVAIVDECPTAGPGHGDVENRGSLHVVEGTW